MDMQEVKAGNVTYCKSPAVIRQAAYEKRKSAWLANGIVHELELMKSTYESCLGSKVTGYILSYTWRYGSLKRLDLCYFKSDFDQFF